MTVADISTHSEGKRADISSWVTKLGSNYIALSRQPWLLLTRPDIWSVSGGYQFCSPPPIQHGLTHFVMYFGCTHGLLDIILLAGCFLWVDSSVVHTFSCVTVNGPWITTVPNSLFCFSVWPYSDLYIQHLIRLDLMKGHWSLWALVQAKVRRQQ